MPREGATDNTTRMYAAFLLSNSFVRVVRPPGSRAISRASRWDSPNRHRIVFNESAAVVADADASFDASLLVSVEPDAGAVLEVVLVEEVPRLPLFFAATADKTRHTCQDCFFNAHSFTESGHSRANLEFNAALNNYLFLNSTKMYLLFV